MPLAEYPLDERRVRALTALYSETRNEITRYRDYEWRITAYALTFFAGCMVLGLNDEFSKLWSILVKGVFITLLAMAAIVALGFLGYSHTKYLEHRRRRQVLDGILGFSSKGLFEDGVVLVPSQTIKFWSGGACYPIAFCLLIGSVGFLTITIFAKK